MALADNQSESVLCVPYWNYSRIIYVIFVTIVCLNSLIWCSHSMEVVGFLDFIFICKTVLNVMMKFF